MNEEEIYVLELLPEELEIVKTSMNNVDLIQVEKETREQLNKEKQNLERQSCKSEEEFKKLKISPVVFNVNPSELQEKVNDSNGKLELTEDEAIFLTQVVLNAEKYFPHKNIFDLYNQTALKISMFSAFHTNSFKITAEVILPKAVQ